MTKLPRLVWELLILIILAAAGWGFWTWSENRWQARLVASEEQLRSELAAERRQIEEQIQQRGASEAQTVAQAFAAGLAATKATGNAEMIDVAVGNILRMPGVVFVHVLDRAGGVIATSDRKLVATGEAGPRAAWALEAQETRSRPGNPPEVSEVAIPLAGESESVLWLGYELPKPPA